MSERDAAADEAARDNLPAVEDAAAAADHDVGVDSGMDEIETLKAEAAENWAKYLRAVAEIDNLRKRTARDIENARKYGAERLVAAILPVLDSLEAALKVASQADPGTVTVETLLEGDRATLRLLEQALESAGFAEINPEGEPFDPERHEAMSLQPSPTAEPNSVVMVVQKGAELHGRVVRPARVIVACAPDPAAAQEP